MQDFNIIERDKEEYVNFEMIYIIWFASHGAILWFLFGKDIYLFIGMVALYILSICIALSSIGEKILRFMNGARRIATSKEKERLSGLLDEICKEAKEKGKTVSKGIKLYIIDAMTINAYALGKNTVCITKGAMQIFTDDELKGILAHEVGHIINQDYNIMLLNFVGNGIFTCFVFIQRIVFKLLDLMVENFHMSKANIILSMVKGLFDIFVLIILSVSQMIFSIHSRQAEYFADKIAHTLGYGNELIEALYILQNTEITADMKITDRMKQTHPQLAYRIERLEELQEK